MSIAVTSDSNYQSARAARCADFEKRRIEAGVLPGVAEAFIQLLEGEREHFAHIENHPAALKSDFRLFNKISPLRQRRSRTILISSRIASRRGRGETFIFE